MLTPLPPIAAASYAIYLRMLFIHIDILIDSYVMVTTQKYIYERPTSHVPYAICHGIYQHQMSLATAARTSEPKHKHTEKPIWVYTLQLKLRIQHGFGYIWLYARWWVRGIAYT